MRPGAPSGTAGSGDLGPADKVPRSKQKARPPVPSGTAAQTSRGDSPSTHTVPDAGDAAANQTDKASAFWGACLLEKADSEEVRSSQRLMKPVSGIGKDGGEREWEGGVNGVPRGGF